MLRFGRPEMKGEIQIPVLGILNVISTIWKLEVEVQIQVA